MGPVRPKTGILGQLCNQEQLRYHFEIKNKYTNHTLWVGSQCILKFQLQVYENGRSLNKVDAKKKLNKLIRLMKIESCIKFLERLADRENNNILSNALVYYQKNKYLTPKFAFVVLWKLKTYKIDHNPSFFKISLKRDKYKHDLALMPPDRVHTIWPALSSSQRKIAQQFGHTPPNN